MRLFVALDIDEEIRKQIEQFIEEVRGLAPDVRWVTPESLHVTLKYIGEKPKEVVAEIEKAARVFWVGIEGDDGLTQLAGKVEGSLAGIGIPKEERAFSPHLTLARGGARIGSGSGAPGRRSGDRVNQKFAKLQQRLSERLAEPASEPLSEHPGPDFGTMAAREFFLYRSQLSPKGARYTKIARFELR